MELDEAGLETLMVCGGVGLVEKTDIVAELGWLVELEPLYQVPVDSVTVVRAESLVKRACFATGASEEGFCHGAAGTLVVLGVLWSMAVTGSGVETSSVTAWRSAEGLLRTLYQHLRSAIVHCGERATAENLPGVPILGGAGGCEGRLGRRRELVQRRAVEGVLAREDVFWRLQG